MSHSQTRLKGLGMRLAAIDFVISILSAVKNEEQAAGEPDKPAEPEEQEPTSAEPEQEAADPEKQLEPATAGARYLTMHMCEFTILHLENFVTLARFSLYKPPQKMAACFVGLHVCNLDNLWCYTLVTSWKSRKNKGHLI